MPDFTLAAPTSLAHTDPARLAVEDLAERLSISEGTIEVISIEQAELPLQNLGCGAKSQEGVVIPAIVTGWIVRLQVDENLYEYRVHHRRVVLCE